MNPIQIEHDLIDNPSKKMKIYSEEIRKDRRHQILAKRRVDFSMKVAAQGNMSNEKEQEAQKLSLELAEKYKEMFQSLIGTDPLQQELAITTFQKLSETDPDFTLALSFKEDLIIAILEHSIREGGSKCLIPAAKTIANLSAGSEVNSKILIDRGLHKYTLRSMEVFGDESTEHLLLAIGNLVGESVQYRDFCLEFGLGGSIIEYVVRFNSRNGVWALCNLSRGIPQPNPIFCTKAFPILIKKATAKTEDPSALEMAQDCIWTLDELTTRPETVTLIINETGYLFELAEAFNHATKYSILHPLFQIFENLIASKAKAFHEFFIKFLLPTFSEKIPVILDAKYRLSICKIIQLALTEDAAVNSALIETSMILHIIKMIGTDHKEVSKEASVILNKFVKYCSYDQLEKLVNLGLLESVCDSLLDTDMFLVINLLEIIERVLEKAMANQSTYFSDKLQAIGGIYKLEQLQDSHNDKIYKKSLDILEKFFETEEL